MTDKMDLIKRGRRDELREKKAGLETRLRRLSGDVLLQSSDILGVEKINAEATLQAAQELKAAMDEYKAVKAELAKLEN